MKAVIPVLLTPFNRIRTLITSHKTTSTLSLTAAVFLLASGLPVHASNLDSRIEQTAHKSYVFKTYLQGDDIKIQSKKGAVTLTGLVAENFHKSLAQETVAGLPGVSSVDNRLEVKGAPPTANSDVWLGDKVKLSLLFHRNVNTNQTEVDVKDGIVTLRGTAATKAQKEMITAYATSVEGLREVKNEMIVTPHSKKRPRTVGEKIDDASISAQVNMMLLNHRSTSVINTKIRTKRGVVTVGGKAKNTAEKVLVTKLVADINGVTSVRNRMTIE